MMVSSIPMRTESVAVKIAAWGKNACLCRERSGLWRFRFGTKIDRGWVGHWAVT